MKGGDEVKRSFIQEDGKNISGGGDRVSGRPSFDNDGNSHRHVASVVIQGDRFSHSPNTNTDRTL